MSSADRKTRASSHGSRTLAVAAWALSSEDRAFALRLASRTGLSSVRYLPSMEQFHVPDIARNATMPRLTLDQPEALLRQDEEIDLVDGSVIGLELEIGPRPVGIVVGQTGTHEIKSVSLVVVLRRSDDLPAWGFHASLSANGNWSSCGQSFCSPLPWRSFNFLQHRIEVFPAKQTVVVHRMPVSDDLSRRFPVPKGIRRHAEVIGCFGDPEIIPQLDHTTVSPRINHAS